VRLLLDTHSFLWFINGSPQISTSARTLIEDASNQPFLSVASLWEMAIKVEQMPIVSGDTAFDAYTITRLW